MYNSELKEKFIEKYAAGHNASTVYACVTAFKAIGKYEREWDADFCTKTTEELQPVVDKLVGLRSRSGFARLLMYKDYVRFCIGIGVPGACDGMLGITAAGLDKMRAETVANPLQFENYLDAVFEPVERETIDNVYRCFCWMAFAGMSDLDILRLRNENIDFMGQVIRIDGEEYPLYREAVSVTKHCMTATRLTFLTEEGEELEKRRADGDKIIRGFRGNFSRDSMRQIMSKRTKAALGKRTSKRMSYEKIWLSGMFYRTYEQEKAEGIIDFETQVQEFIKDKEYRLGGRNTIEGKKRQVERDYVNDYRRWKLAHNL